MNSGAWILPISAGIGYSMAVASIRKALCAGVSGSRVNLACNVVMALLFQCLWLFPCAPFAPSELSLPLVCGFLFFLGQVLTFRAISSGDVSLSTPLMGTKVLFVAFFTMVIAHAQLPGSWLMACLMASAGIALISWGHRASGRGVGRVLFWSLAAAAVFALTDLLVQVGVPRVGYTRFAPVMFGAMGLFSLLYLPDALRPDRSGDAVLKAHAGRSLPWLISGALLLAVQSLAMYSSIGLYGSAALTNILYGSRCLWSVLLAWLMSALLHGKGDAGKTPHRVMLRRFAGAILLLSAMTLVLVASPR